MGANIFTSFLRLLKVKHTNSFSNKYFNENPNKYNLFGISSMLSYYGVENKALNLKDKNDIYLLETPFIAHTNTDFVIVEEILAQNIQYIWNDKKLKISTDNFFEMWTGIILMADSDTISAEPDYKKHLREEFLNLGKNGILVSILLFAMFYVFFQNKIYNSVELILLYVINLFGSFIGYLLILKQLRIQSNYGDKICSLFKHGDCNNILESDVAKLFGIIGWSEIGLGYFITNLIVISFLPEFINWLIILNFFTLPYTFWSIWFQKFKVRQWCVLCLVVQVLLWLIFILGISFEFYNTNLTFVGLVTMISLYVVFILLVNISISVLSKGIQAEKIRYEINSIKATEDVFRILLKQQPYIEIEKNASRILFGNPDSDLLITIISNPHCNPCAKMHKRIDEFVEQNKYVCIQYIFSSFNKDLDYSNRFLIATYLKKGKDLSKLIFSQWFEQGRYNKDAFFAQNEVDVNNMEVLQEFKTHEEWINRSGLRTTPTILINGYKLPDNYKIEDMRFFTKIKI